MRGYPPLIRKESITHMQGLAVYMKEGLHFAWGLSLKKSVDSYLCFWLALLRSVSYFFCLYQTPSSSLWMVFDSVSSNIDEVLFISSSANVFLFGDFNVHHKDWLTYSCETDRPGELYYNFTWSHMISLRWFTFYLGPWMWLSVLLFWIYSFPRMLVFVLRWLSFYWEILIMLLSQFLLTFQDKQNKMPHFIA